MTTVTTQAPANVKGATMAEIRKALPEFFSLTVERAIMATTSGTTGSEARRVNLARALVGAALEKMQSGNNAGALGNTTAAVEALKGKAAERVNNALALVLALPNKGMHAEGLDAYRARAADLLTELVGILTPEQATPKAPAERVDWKARAATYEEEAKTLRAEVVALVAALEAAGAKVPAIVRPLAAVA